MDSEFTIRVTGGSPPPLLAASTLKGGGGKNAALLQQQKRYNMRLRPSTPLGQFRQDVFALFDIPSCSTHLYHVSFLAGFPPTELDQNDKHTVHELGVRANESVIVKFTLYESAGIGSTTSTAKQSSSSAATVATDSPISNSNNGRQKRAAATAAVANFPELVAAQDAMLKAEQKKKSSTIKSFGNRVATKPSHSPNSKKNKKAKIEGTGYRLSDGKAFDGEVSKRKVSSKGQQSLFKSEDDIAGKLLSSIGGVGGGNIGMFLRKAMKGAVEKSYEESRAAVRVAAVNQGAFSFEKVKGGTVVEGEGIVLGTAKDHDEKIDGIENDADNHVLRRTMYMVSYSKGLEGRGRYEEQVEIISLDALKGLIEHVYNTRSEGESEGDSLDDKNSDGREMLRPLSIAHLSPRVFWSLVYHCSRAEQNQSSANATVETMLQSLIPHLDWSHLDRGGRKRNLSEKARENLRQEKDSALSTACENGIHAIEEIEETILETAMLSYYDGKNDLSERERRARAAMARFGNNGETETSTSPPVEQDHAAIDEWKLVTPSEDDIDELIECIMEGKESESYDDNDAKVWAAVLVDNVRNWRGLANADSEVILSQVNIDDNLQVETVEKWIDVAQQRSIEEIMLDILDGDQDALDSLLDKARSSTPKDLSFWCASPRSLLDTLSKGEDEVAITWNETDVKRWTSRAKIALSTLPWLDLYLTKMDA